MNNQRITGEDKRSAQIQRQHSQEMSLRLLAQIGFADGGSVPDENEVLSKVKFFTDWFERDIGESVALRAVSAPINGDETLSGDQKVAIQQMVDESEHKAGVLDACCMEAMMTPWEGGKALEKMTKPQARAFVANLHKVGT